MKKMLFLSAAIMTLATAAFAQDRGDHGGGGGGNHPAPAAHAAPHAAPAPHPAPQGRPVAAPHSAAQAAHQDNHGASHGPDNNAGYSRGPNGTDNRAAFTNSRPAAGNNRPGPDNSAHNNNARPNNAHNGPGPGANNHPRPNPNYAQYHRNFNATRHFHRPSYVRPSGWYAQRWTYGQFLPSLFWTQNYWLNDYNDYDLPPPPPGAVWVQDGDDALLIDQSTGEIIQVEYGAFD